MKKVANISIKMQCIIDSTVESSHIKSMLIDAIQQPDFIAKLLNANIHKEEINLIFSDVNVDIGYRDVD